jgi:hypothetical protein
MSRRISRWIVEQCYHLAYRGTGTSYDEWLAEGGEGFDITIPVRIVAVRIVAQQMDGCSSPKEDGRYSGEKRRRIARLIEDTVDGLLSGAIEIPATLPIPASGVHRHRAEPRRSKQDDPKRFAGCGVHRIAREGGRVLRKNHFDY